MVFFWCRIFSQKLQFDPSPPPPFPLTIRYAQKSSNSRESPRDVWQLISPWRTFFRNLKTKKTAFHTYKHLNLIWVGLAGTCFLGMMVIGHRSTITTILISRIEVHDKDHLSFFGVIINFYWNSTNSRFSDELVNFRGSRPKVFCKKGVLRNFTKFTGKNLCQSLFFNKVAAATATANNISQWPRIWQVFFSFACLAKIKTVLNTVLAFL